MYVLFKTVHGSRLYGLNHADSDEDFYTVVSKVKTNRAKYSTQSIVDGIDSVVVDMGTWLHQCEAGVPQALEAMFSSMPIVDEIAAFRNNYTTGTGVYARYFRTIKSFAMEGSFKRKRHALRLALNLSDMASAGRFNPTLSKEDITLINNRATYDADEVYNFAKDMAAS